ncbi:hypothetical protein QEH59_05465 [Coraliomargarita sp. SDUM461004]|uniref:Uncharacterized protein n=1 Tax=Thalassobacterium sedimentorum TaxID=3041258 RepID=A0ABU1AGE0_9BACT|nr:hypothetical protein [Coraliomargarita sp. SDUM461004]MDQ8193861.1 hypothetical protein [Coraliomargarita sp. SDUM461004]
MSWRLFTAYATLYVSGLLGEPIDVRLRLQTEVAAPYDFEAYIRSVWKSGIMTNESVFFLSLDDGGPVRASLLFTPEKVLSVQNGMLNQAYQEGVDFKLVGNQIELIPETSIPVVPYEQFHPKSQSGQSIRIFWFSGLNRFALSPEGAWFHQHQVFISYEYAGDRTTDFVTGTPRSPERLQNTVSNYSNYFLIRIYAQVIAECLSPSDPESLTNL